MRASQRRRTINYENGSFAQFEFDGGVEFLGVRPIGSPFVTAISRAEVTPDDNGVGVRAASFSGVLIDGLAGGLPRFRMENNGDVLAHGTFMNNALDFAEMTEVEDVSRPEAESYEPGDVLIISPETGKLKKGGQPYCPLVAGVCSTHPGFLGGQGFEPSPSHKVPLALIGQVPCKVITERSDSDRRFAGDVVNAGRCDERDRPQSDARRDCGQSAGAIGIRH
jgi:hypothetical protein